MPRREYEASVRANITEEKAFRLIPAGDGGSNHPGELGTMRLLVLRTTGTKITWFGTSLVRNATGKRPLSACLIRPDWLQH